MEEKYKAAIYTLGCRVNFYESESIAEALIKNGFSVCDFSEKCDVYIINTCTVTSESDRKSRQMIRRAIKNNPNAKILVCGCYSQVNPNEVKKIDSVDFICGTRNKMLIVSKALELVKKDKSLVPETNVIDPYSAGFELMEATSQDRTRAFLKIEDGCNNNCSYCIIPKARGSVCSKPKEDVIDEVKKIVENGYKEIVLTGIEIAAYGIDFGYSLIDILEELEKIDGLYRIRLGSVDPAYLKEGVIDRLSKLTKTMPHFHLSLQSGTDKTLNNMKRRYNTKMIKRSVSYMREIIPNVTFGADIIAGFPCETDSDHKETLEFIETLELLNSHIFPYSIRPGTEAAKMKEQISSEIKEKRCKEIQYIAEVTKKRCIQRFIDNKTELEVLFENYKDGYNIGHTDNFIYVKVRTDKDICKSIHKVVLKKYDEKEEITEGELI